MKPNFTDALCPRCGEYVQEWHDCEFDLVGGGVNLNPDRLFVEQIVATDMNQPDRLLHAPVATPN